VTCWSILGEKLPRQRRIFTIVTVTLPARRSCGKRPGDRNFRSNEGRRKGALMTVNRYGLVIVIALLLLATSGSTAEVALDYDVYRNRVEPIFLKKRPGHGRCYNCHAESNNAFRLQKLSPGSKSWTEEQSQRNFQTIIALVVAGEPDASKLLLHPLAPEAGGLAFHSGGRQFNSKNDPDWKILAQWVRGQKN